MGTKVTLRQRPIAGNKQSLYLDFYPAIPSLDNGKPKRREFLKHFVYSPIKTKTNKKGEPTFIYDDDKTKNAEYKLHNENTLKLAEQIRSNKQNVLDKPEVYSGQEKEVLRIKELGERSFIQYFKQLGSKRKESTSNTWTATIKHIESFTNGLLTFAELNEKFCNDFGTYLLTTKKNKRKALLSKNSAALYFNIFKTALLQAYTDDILQIDLNKKCKPLEKSETTRNILSIEELNQLVKAECKSPIMKNAAIFSAMTGLRFSDIEKMRWSELEENTNGHLLKYTQRKTSKIEELPISEQAFSLLGDRKQPTDKVFENLGYSGYQNLILGQWIARAGITKEITFHCFRHTFATLQLSAGTDIYTISKMLGHRNLKTTEIYVKVLEKEKREAVNRISLDL